MYAVCMASHFDKIIIQISNGRTMRGCLPVGLSDFSVQTLRHRSDAANKTAYQTNNNIQHPFHGLLNDVDVAAVALWIFPLPDSAPVLCVSVFSLFFYSSVLKQNSRDSLFIPTMSDALVSPVLMNKLHRKVGVCIFTL